MHRVLCGHVAPLPYLPAREHVQRPVLRRGQYDAPRRSQCHHGGGGLPAAWEAGVPRRGRQREGGGAGGVGQGGGGAPGRGLLRGVTILLGWVRRQCMWLVVMCVVSEGWARAGAVAGWVPSRRPYQ